MSWLRGVRVLALLGCLHGSAWARTYVYVENRTDKVLRFSVETREVDPLFGPLEFEGAGRAEAKPLDRRAYELLRQQVSPGERARVLRLNRNRYLGFGRRYRIDLVAQVGGSSLHLSQDLMAHSYGGSDFRIGVRDPATGRTPWTDDDADHHHSWASTDGVVPVRYRTVDIPGADDDAEYVFLGASAAEPATPDFKITTYNLWFLPDTLFTGDSRPRQRAGKIAPHLRGDDVVVLNEAFEDGARDRLVRALQDEYPYVAGVLNPAYGMLMNGGVVILSRWPIGATDSIKFRKKGMADTFNQKGALYARIDRPDGPHHVFATHTKSGLSASDARTRASQLRELTAFRTSKAIPETEPVLIVGDLNVDRTSAEFPRVLALLGAEEPAEPSGQDATYDPRVNALASDDDPPEWLDYVLTATGHAAPVRATIECRRPLGEDGEDLSDHFPVRGTFRFQPSASVEAAAPGAAARELGLLGL